MVHRQLEVEVVVEVHTLLLEVVEGRILQAVVEVGVHTLLGVEEVVHRLLLVEVGHKLVPVVEVGVEEVEAHTLQVAGVEVAHTLQEVVEGGRTPPLVVVEVHRSLQGVHTALK